MKLIRLLFVSIFLMGEWSIVRAEILTVAAAADLKFALEDCLTVFRAEHPGIDIKTSYGSSGILCAQIANGAPFDLFLSADRKYPETLLVGGHAVEGALFPYAVGRLAVWVPGESPIDVEHLGMEALKLPAAARVAVANPNHAPYGQAAVAAMKSMGVYEAVKSKLVFGENIAQTAQFVESGAADIGIVSLSLAVAPPLAGKGRYWKVPLEAFPRMEQAGVVLAKAENPAAARELAAFLQSATGREILKKFGFLLPGEE